MPIAELLPEQTSRKAFQSQIKDLLAKYRPTLETGRRFLLEQDEFADLARKSSVRPAASSALRCGRSNGLTGTVSLSNVHLGESGRQVMTGPPPNYEPTGNRSVPSSGAAVGASPVQAKVLRGES